MVDNGSSPVVRTGDIEEANFTINKVVNKDGEVVEQQVEAELDEEFMADIEEEIDSSIDSALSAFEEGAAETVEEAVERGLSGADFDTSAGTQTTQTTQQQTSSASAGGDGDAEDVDPPDEVTESVVDAAEEVVFEKQITLNDWVELNSTLTNRGISSGQQQTSEIWDRLKERDVIPTNWDDESAPAADSDAEEDGEDEDEGEDGPALAESGSAVEEEVNVAQASYVATGSVLSSTENEIAAAVSDEFGPAVRFDDGVTVATFEYDPETREYANLDTTPGEEWIEDPEAAQSDDGGSGDADDDAGSVETPEDIPEVPVGEDILLLEPDQEASESVSQELSQAIGEQEVLAIPTTAEFGAFLKEKVPSGTTVPAYLRTTEGGYESRELRELVEKHDGGEESSAGSPAPPQEEPEADDVDGSGGDTFTSNGIEIEPGTDALVGFDSDDTTQMALDMLTEAFVEGELAYADLEEEFGEAVVAEVDDPPDAPFYAIWTGDGWEARDLEALFAKYV